MHLKASLYRASAAKHKHASSKFKLLVVIFPLLDHLPSSKAPHSRRLSGKIPTTALVIGQCVGGVAKQVSAMRLRLTVTLTYHTYLRLQASSSDSRPLKREEEDEDPARQRFASGGTH